MLTEHANNDLLGFTQKFRDLSRRRPSPAEPEESSFQIIHTPDRPRRIIFPEEAPSEEECAHQIAAWHFTAEREHLSEDNIKHQSSYEEMIQGNLTSYAESESHEDTYSLCQLSKKITLDRNQRLANRHSNQPQPVTCQSISRYDPAVKFWQQKAPETQNGQQMKNQTVTHSASSCGGQLESASASTASFSIYSEDDYASTQSNSSISSTVMEDQSAPPSPTAQTVFEETEASKKSQDRSDAPMDLYCRGICPFCRGRLKNAPTPLACPYQNCGRDLRECLTASSNWTSTREERQKAPPRLADRPLLISSQPVSRSQSPSRQGAVRYPPRTRKSAEPEKYDHCQETPAVLALMKQRKVTDKGCNPSSKPITRRDSMSDLRRVAILQQARRMEMSGTTATTSTYPVPGPPPPKSPLRAHPKLQRKLPSTRDPSPADTVKTLWPSPLQTQNGYQAWKQQLSEMQSLQKSKTVKPAAENKPLPPRPLQTSQPTLNSRRLNSSRPQQPQQKPPDSQKKQDSKLSNLLNNLSLSLFRNTSSTSKHPAQSEAMTAAPTIPEISPLSSDGDGSKAAFAAAFLPSPPSPLSRCSVFTSLISPGEPLSGHGQLRAPPPPPPQRPTAADPLGWPGMGTKRPGTTGMESVASAPKSAKASESSVAGRQRGLKNVASIALVSACGARPSSKTTTFDIKNASPSKEETRQGVRAEGMSVAPIPDHTRSSPCRDVNLDAVLAWKTPEQKAQLEKEMKEKGDDADLFMDIIDQYGSDEDDETEVRVSRAPRLHPEMRWQGGWI